MNIVVEAQAKVMRCCGPDDCGEKTGEALSSPRLCVASNCMAWRWRMGLWNIQEDRWWKSGDKAAMDVEERQSDYGSCGLSG